MSARLDTEVLQQMVRMHRELVASTAGARASRPPVEFNLDAAGETPALQRDADVLAGAPEDDEIFPARRISLRVF